MQTNGKSKIIRAHAEKYEIRPGAEAFDYMFSWFMLNRLSKKAGSRDRKFFLDVTSGVDRAILNSGVFEKAIIEIIREVCVSTEYIDQLVDIGANIGNHTVCLSDIFKNVSAIEPNPVIFKILEANILRNGIENVLCFNFGLAKERSLATLIATSENHSLGKIKGRTTLGADAFNIGEEKFDIEHQIQLESTAEFFSDFAGKGRKAFIKIDVEGMEQEILTQLLPFIQAEEPIVGFEWYVREQLGIKEILASLKNYTAYVIDSNEDHISNSILKGLRLFIKGRKFIMQRYDPENLKSSYPLVMLIPSRLNGIVASG